MLDTREAPKGKVVSAGYPGIEQLIDSEDFTNVNEVFEKAYNELSDQSRIKRGLKRSREAKKAMRAIELTMSLFKELLEIKYRIQEMLKRSQTKRA
ncbi:MAG: hypothetical protein COX62_03590 [Deltaproteobacteria bacterium CG_4_10_14_0_2_um_filter_43_8]|nr:MAG: hypothetical protein COV46_03990 [Deltaproteobacteria bacterium CG11_big_fil_rev_8_21_14_0_20_49_13]PJA21024.1 MAG: hypothetical protein COX62_03590 [Deltaproteobacteria bacterium CG_4_10_14_0_2_um_filter_43_8]